MSKYNKTLTELKSVKTRHPTSSCLVALQNYPVEVTPTKEGHAMEKTTNATQDLSSMKRAVVDTKYEKLNS
jgi:hypothetical protein